MTRIPTTGPRPGQQPEPRREEDSPVTDTLLIVGDAAPIIARAPRDALAEAADNVADTAAGVAKASAGAIGGLLRSLRDL
ncbi:MAG: hypothetical protein K2X46_10435 [Roseomonas sp.]|nr:hypothetical protein [Roseomonas sp.]